MTCQAIIRSEYEVRNNRGTLLRTFEQLDLAKAWTRDNDSRFDGLTVEHVEVLETRRRIYRPRLKVVGGRTL